MTNEYNELREYLKNAKLGSFLLVPLKYDNDSLDYKWLDENAVRAPFETMDLTQSVKQTINADNTANVISRYIIPKETVLQELLGGNKTNVFYACEKGNEDFSKKREFSIQDMEIYIFHTQVAFVRFKIQFSRVFLLDTICNFGYTENNVEYYYSNENGEKVTFDLEGGIEKICGHSNLRLFFKSKASMFLECYTYTLAVTEKRFKEIETMRQATFNLHLMVELEDALEDESEEDVNYVYAVKDQTIGSYRWGCCVTSQTISYIIGNKDCDIDYEMDNHAENELPVVLLALYQKYTCLRFKELIAITDKKKAKRIKKLKKQLLEFQAYGTIPPANISRWHNIKQIYTHIMDTNGVQQAVEDINITVNLLSEQQKEMETAKSDAIMGLITLFSIVSIPTSIIGLLDVLKGGNSMNVITAVVSLVSVVFVIVLMLLYKERT